MKRVIAAVCRLLKGESARFFDDEIVDSIKHDKRGTLSMANAGPNTNGSQVLLWMSVRPACVRVDVALRRISLQQQFILTCRDGIDFLDGKNTAFGYIAEGLDVLSAINEAFVDEKFRPLYDIR